jgi:hypothetical protein
MKLFKNFMGETVNLDDMSLYPEIWGKMNIHDLFSKCMREAGRSLFYMDFLHKDVSWDFQRERVNVLCEELSNIWNYVRKFERDRNKTTLFNEDEYRAALMEWLYRFKDETENQC